MPGTYVSIMHSNKISSRNADKIKTFYRDGGTGDFSEGVSVTEYVLKMRNGNLLKSRVSEICVKKFALIKELVH